MEYIVRTPHDEYEIFPDKESAIEFLEVEIAAGNFIARSYSVYKVEKDYEVQLVLKENAEQVE